IGMLVLLLAMGWVVRPWQANRECRVSDEWLASDPRQALSHVEKAIQLDPGQEMGWAKLGGAAQAAAAKAADPEKRRRLLLKPDEAIRPRLTLPPVNAYHHDNYGRLLVQMVRAELAKPEQTFAAFDRALALDPQNANFYLDAATAAVQLSDHGRARCYAE